MAPSAPAAVTTPSGRTFLVLAHRGNGAGPGENSRDAYLAAATAGYDGIETDIQFSSDHVAVMSHSDSLKPGNAGGSDCMPALKIHKTTWAELQTVKCKDAEDNYTVPLATFDDLVDAMSASPTLQLTLDIKKYSGASAKAQRDYARRAAKLIIANGLVGRTRILTYNWDVMLPTLRKYLPKTYVLAYDHSDFSYARVRLAAKLKASGYGVEARLTSVNLARFIKARKLEVVPWNLSGAPATQGTAFSIFYGPKTYWFLTDAPAAQMTALQNGTKLDWAATPVTTPLAAPVQVDKATYKAGKYRYPKVLGKGAPLPASARFALDTVTVTIGITKGAKGNYAYVGARGADASARKKVKLPSGTGTIQVSVPVGDAGRIRIKTKKKSKLTVQVVSSTTMSFS
jgi:glycerophosphoryl diester phosphodiesterase